jgi:2-methylisocitrate lyase-like PEP mutase family enzyme
MTAWTIKDLASKAERLRSLHIPGDPVVLPNAWDAASAKTLVDAGFSALATSSSAVAEALGYADGEGTPAEEMFSAIARLTRTVEVPVTADIERGYALSPDEIVDRLIAAGAIGCNLEDSDPTSEELVPIDDQAEWLAEVRTAAEEAGVPVVVNARVDVHLRKWGAAETRLDEAVRRAKRYLEAGADCVYPIFLNDPAELRSFVDRVEGPVNAVFLPGSSISEFASTGVARVSFGGGLHAAMRASLERLAKRIAVGEDPYSS